MNISITNKDPSTLAATLVSRFGDLALARAAGEVSSAERNGDQERRAMWYSVVAHLRRAITS